MSILVDWEIRDLCVPGNGRALITPFSEGVQGNGVISYGLSHAGYDLRLGGKVLMFKNTYAERVDPKEVKSHPERVFDIIDGLQPGERVWIPPQGYILGYSMEYIRMPGKLKGTCIGKSTLARCGIHVNTTPLEPGWEGFLTLEIANHTPCSVCVYSGEGIAQLEFHRLYYAPERDYAAKDGKYQFQGAEPVPARVK